MKRSNDAGTCGSRFMQLDWVMPSQEVVTALTKTCDYNSRIELGALELKTNCENHPEISIVS